MLTSHDIHNRLNTDFYFYAKNAPLMIKDKEGNVISFVLNRAQQYIHNKLEEQKRTLGRVRACILKGRQQGCSTYVSARFFHRTTRNKGISTFILSHEGKTTDKLFRMVDRYQENINDALKPEEGAANRYQKTYPRLDSDYAVGTAGNENVGRGGTAQQFHGSEAAYWEKADAIQDGALESIGDVNGTEIILESTANGPNGLFYRKCISALKGEGDYQLIFVPWFWQEEYERPDNGSELTEEERGYLELVLDEYPFDKAKRKVLWRRNKLIDLCTSDNPASGAHKFKQIYPSNPIEAFQATGLGLIRSDAIIAARKSTLKDVVAPVVMGVDPAGDTGGDRTVIVIRKGREILKYLKYDFMKPMRLAGICAGLIDQYHVDQCFVDVGHGHGTIDRLHELGYKRTVQGVAFNERSLQPDVYLNKRSEIIIAVASWVNGGDVNIPDDDEIHADLACMPLDIETSNGLKYIIAKREIKKLLGRSPDVYDALALTFAFPVRNMDGGNRNTFVKATGSKGGEHGPLTSLNKFRSKRR